MKPILLSFGSFHIYSFGLMVALGVLTALFLMERLAAKNGFPPAKKVADLLFVTVFSGFLGARIFYAAQNIEIFVTNPLSFFAFWEGGLIFYGGIPGSLIGIAIFCRHQNPKGSDPFGFCKALDFLIPFTALVHAFGRVGCFLNGCCAGKACDLPWAVRFPDSIEAVHPTQLYEAGFLIGLFLTLYFLYPKRKFDGQISLCYFAFYAVGRFFLEFFREGNPTWHGLTVNQWMSIGLFAVSILFILLCHLRAGLGGNRHL